jgi:excisionase family DNA binding protein
MGYKNEKCEHEFLTVPEAARILRVDKRTIYRYLALGIIKRRKVAGRTLISRAELQSLLDAH